MQPASWQAHHIVDASINNSLLITYSNEKTQSNGSSQQAKMLDFFAARRRFKIWKFKMKRGEHCRDIHKGS
eukprot:1030330-Ditylum_brightwellii.AAC.2